MQQNIQRLTKPQRIQVREDVETGIPVGRKDHPRAYYIYVMYPKKWYWEEDHGWFPRPSIVTGQPGANGVQDPGWGKPVRHEHMRRTLGDHREKGGLIVHPQDAKLAIDRREWTRLSKLLKDPDLEEQPWMNYNGYFETRGGGRWYVEIGAEVVVTPTGEKLWNGNTCRPKVREFHRHLRDSGLGGVLLHEYFEQKMELESRTLERRITAAGKSPGLMHRVDEQRARIEKMRADYAVYAKGVSTPTVGETAPKRTSKPRKKTEAAPESMT